MRKTWLESTVAGAPVRRELAPGLTRIGGPRGEIPVAGSGSDALHLWDQPPKLIFVGSGEMPRVNGFAVDEAELESGDRIEWRGESWRLSFDDGETRAQPAADPPPAVFRALASAQGASERQWRRVKAGLLIDMNLVERTAVKRWQDSVGRGDFDPDACASELLDGGAAVPVASDDPRLLERTTRLLRDFIKPRAKRGTSRPSGLSAKEIAAFVLSQVLVFIIYGATVIAALIAVRAHYKTSIDSLLDRIAKMF